MKRLILVMLILPTALSMSACGAGGVKMSNGSGTPPVFSTNTRSSRGGKNTVGLVTDIGGLDDKSFNHDAFLGTQEARAAYGVETSVTVSKSQTDYVPNLMRYAQERKGLTIAVGFLMQAAIYQVARSFPRAHFAIIDGAPTDSKGVVHNLPNVANLFFREQEAGFLVGVLAGSMEKHHVKKATHGVVCYLGGVSIPPVDRYIAGYVAGAQTVFQGVRVLGGYSQSFSDQAAGKNIGLIQISRGCDVLFQVAGASGLGYLAAAQQRGVYGVGADADQGYLGNYVVASAIKRVDAAVKHTIRSVVRGTFTGGDHRFILRNGGIGFVTSHGVVPPSIVNQVQVYEHRIAKGSIVPPEVIPSH